MFTSCHRIDYYGKVYDISPLVNLSLDYHLLLFFSVNSAYFVWGILTKTNSTGEEGRGLRSPTGGASYYYLGYLIEDFNLAYLNHSIYKLLISLFSFLFFVWLFSWFVDILNKCMRNLNCFPS